MFKVNNKDTSKEQAIVNFEHVNASWPWTKKKTKKNDDSNKIPQATTWFVNCVWLNDWVFVDELSECGFEFRYSVLSLV